MEVIPSDPVLPENEISIASKILVSSLVPSVARAVKLSHEFPSSSTPAFTYYNDFPQYKAVMNGNSNKILALIQQIIDTVHGEVNVLDAPNPKSMEEKFAAVVDVNDRIIDRVTVEMDKQEFPERANNNNNAQDLVVAIQNKSSSSLRSFNEDMVTEQQIQPNTQYAPIKLLAAKNISRPQTLFSRQPDNSSAPFQPLLTTKPHAILPLEKSNCVADSESGNYLHPYLCELDAFAKAIGEYIYKPAPNPAPKSLPDTPCEFVDSIQALNEMIRELKSELEIAVDLEHHNYRTYLGITCLLQLSTRTKDYIVDTIALRDHLSCLNEVFADPAIVKVLHGSDMDLMWLQRDFGVYIVNLFDTGRAARALMLPRLSLSYLLSTFAKTVTNKAYQLADWRIRPLPAELIEYARTDTHYLLYIAEQLRGHLFDRGILVSVLERSRELCLRIYKKPIFDSAGYLSLYRMSGGCSLNKRQLYALKMLYNLRDSIARNEDESLQYVLPNHMLKVIAEELPRETTGIFACCSPIPPLVRKYVYDMHKIITDARNNKLSDLGVEESEEYNSLNDNSDHKNITSVPTGMIDLNVLRAPPHDFSRKTTLQSAVDFRKSYKNEVARRNPSKLGTAFEKCSNSSQFSAGKFIDPSRGILHKLLEFFEPLPLSHGSTICKDTPTCEVSLPQKREDPLFTPTKEVKENQDRVTPAEIIQLSELEEGYRSGKPFKSAQSHAISHLKSGERSNVQRRGNNGRQRGSKKGRPNTDFKDSYSRQHNSSMSAVSTPKNSMQRAIPMNDDDMSVVVLRDEKLLNERPTKRVRKRTKKPRFSDMSDAANTSFPHLALPLNQPVQFSDSRHMKGRRRRGFTSNRFESNDRNDSRHFEK